MLLALVPAPASLASRPPPTPADVYTDFVDHGYLTRHYPSGVLRAIIDDAALNQYGDPLVMIRLRLAVRQQLAGQPPGPATASPAPTTGIGPVQTPSSSPGTPAPGKRTAPPKRRRPLEAAAAPALDIVPIAVGLGAIGLVGSGLLSFTLRLRRRWPGRDS